MCDHMGFKIFCGVYALTSLYFQSLRIHQGNYLLHSLTEINKSIQSKQEKDTRKNV